MTAEIAIMNKSAVALAADSAVTITTAQGQKIYNTNKLFMLSKHHPVGVMIYNNAELLRMPWETIIKIYREQLGITSYGTLVEYGGDFIAFLTANVNIFPASEQERYFSLTIKRYLYQIKEDIDDKVKEITKTSKTITEGQLEDCIQASIKEYSDILHSLETLTHFPPDFLSETSIKYEESIEKVIKQVFEELPIPPEWQEQLKLFCVTLFVKKFADPNHSGIVIAGFGDSETFPSLVAFNIFGVVNNVVKYSIYQTIIVDPDNSAAIQPFAQDEMVRAFMTGIDPTLKQTVKGYFSALFEMYPEEIVKLIPTLTKEEVEVLVEKIKEAGRGLVAEFDDSLDRYLRQNFIDPIIDTVEYLPIDELAAMAESLVNLTSFKRRITLVAETVGGPIDVAVISKGDGFVWIKRKHYFEANLNPQFFANYNR
jgi:uncharacterized protein YqgV (UPF0045/DUF77 family)